MLSLRVFDSCESNSRGWALRSAVKLSIFMTTGKKLMRIIVVSAHGTMDDCGASGSKISKYQRQRTMGIVMGALFE